MTAEAVKKFGGVRLHGVGQGNARVSFQGYPYTIKFENDFAVVPNTKEFERAVKPLLVGSGIAIVGRVAADEGDGKPAQTVQLGKAKAEPKVNSSAKKPAAKKSKSKK